MSAGMVFLLALIAFLAGVIFLAFEAEAARQMPRSCLPWDDDLPAPITAWLAAIDQAVHEMAAQTRTPLALIADEETSR